MRSLSRVLLSAFLLLAVSAPAHAQSDAPVGVRAAGMAGAFVAVADDASAVFWNPAGLAAGSYFSLVIDSNALETGNEPTVPRSRSARLIALGTPPLGISYYRTRTITFVENPLPASHASVILQSLTAHHTGVTLVQTIAGTLAIGGTLKVVRGVAAGVQTNGRGGLAQADNLPSRATTKFDTDLGVMVSGHGARAGIQVRNAFEPSFPTIGDALSIQLERRVRAGIALRLLPSVTLAADADITKVETSYGRWRDAAIGTEARLARRLWGRAGVHWNTAGSPGLGAAPITTAGASVTIYGSVLADGQVSFGSENGDRGWGIGARIVF